MKHDSNYFVYGRHTVMAVLRHQPERAKKLLIARASRADEIKNLARSVGVICEEIDRQKLETHFSVGSDAQGLVLLCEPFAYVDLDRIDLSSLKRILVLDSWQDAVNLGRAARGALCFGADLMVICKDRSAQITAAAEKSAVGALSEITVTRVVNLAQAIAKIKDAGFFVYGADERAKITVQACDFATKVALVIGQEGEGLRDLTKKNCDLLLSVPMASKEICLNAADTALILLYELSREEI